LALPVATLILLANTDFNILSWKLWPALSSSWWFVLLLASTGIVTSLPLIWFAEAAKRIPLNVMGFFQYLAPTIQFLIGYLVFHEALGPRLWGFLLIWLGILIFIFDLLGTKRASR
ncbi:MAG: hypothetical protein ACOYOK_12710, partial [Pseudobdellovibrionaceae bacterium]